MTQVPYDDIRRAVDERWLRAKELADALRTDYYDGLVDFDADELRDEAADQLLAMREALLADAQRWRMVREGGGEVVTALAQHLARCLADRKIPWEDRTAANRHHWFGVASGLLCTLEGLVK